MKRDRKYPIGATVYVGLALARRQAVVVRHGRDSYGLYTRVQFTDTGERENFHRSQVFETEKGE